MSALALLQSLIRIPSVNPDGEPGTTEVGEKACAECVGNFLESSGAAVVLEEVLPGRPNVIGRFPSDKKDKPVLLFAPHTDTVSVVGMSVDPFGAEVRDGRVYGRGASDTKGPMAAMLWVLHELREDIPRLPYEIHFAGFMSEETAQHGSKHFAQHHGQDYAFAIIAEPTRLQVVHTHKGCLWATIDTFGRAAHGATPENGVNAIQSMARLVVALDQEFRLILAEASGHDATLGRATMNLGVIQGGSKANIVPDHCRLTVDIRTTPALMQAGGAWALLENFVISIVPNAVLACSYEAQPLFTDPAHPLVAMLAQEHGLAGAPWFCDAALLAQVGVPSVAIGPGSIDQAHTKDEWLSLDDLEAGVAFFKKFLLGLR